MMGSHRDEAHASRPPSFAPRKDDEAMLGKLIAIVSLAALPVGCEGDGGSAGSSAAPAPAEPTVSSAAGAVCADLLSYRGQVEQIMGGRASRT